MFIENGVISQHAELHKCENLSHKRFAHLTSSEELVNVQLVSSPWLHIGATWHMIALKDTDLAALNDKIIR